MNMGSGTYNTVIIVLVFIVIILFCVKFFLKLRPHSSYVREEVEYLEVPYEYNAALSVTENFMLYMETYARREKFMPTSDQEKIDYFTEKMDAMQLSFVFDYGRSLFVRDVESLVSDVAARYVYAA
jgi:heme/copper-type cytochrome/quinol oxidase subunit 2